MLIPFAKFFVEGSILAQDEQLAACVNTCKSNGIGWSLLRP